ncbi:MAG: electron transfer flavoprotein subunit alpha/FixB family protein [Balneolaceae bacterium]|nr:MAG: electron transfer flavoprotein subunit alpha/FixB family protein [Balneolaceae bacterium]
MSTLLTYISVNEGKIKRSSLEVLSRCNELAVQNGFKSIALVIDADPSPVAEQLKQYGADEIYTIQNPIFKNHLNAPLLRALSTVVQQIKPSVVAFASTEGSKDILGALAANLEAASLADVSEFELTETGVKAKRPVMASKIISAVQAEGSPVVLTVRSGSYDVVEKESAATVEVIPFEFSDDQLKTTLKEIIGAAGDKIDLSEAETVIAAGRGVKDEEGRKLVDELASVLNAAIGASRALTEAGVYDPSLQIGQTGKVVSPQLYIGIGISGAIQHVAGMANSKVIVAINKDPDAPIFEIADYGIVGDLYKILPPFIEELKKVKSN